MKKPDSILFQRNNDMHPFEAQTSIEFLCQSNDCSLFSFGSHSKKRPHNLVMGRMYDFQTLDMFEFGIDESTFIPMLTFEVRAPFMLH
jgi:ribosome production factor 2